MSKTPEGNVLEAVCEYLAARRHFFFRINNVGIFDAKKELWRSMPKYSMKGVADVFVLDDGVPVFVEVKSAKGTQSPEQKEFAALVEDNGGAYVLARSINDLQDFGL